MKEQKTIKVLKDYSISEVSKFDLMQKTLREYNLNLSKTGSAIMPAYTDQEMAEYSIYRQLFVAAKFQE